MRIVLALVMVAGCASEQSERKQQTTTANQTEGETTGAGVTPEQNDAIDALFRRKATELQSCWQDEYERNHDRKMEGNITVGLTVTPSGRPQNVRVLQSSMNNHDVEGCVVKAVASWGFPETSADCPYVRTVHLGAQF
jgi:TonB family protein